MNYCETMEKIVSKPLPLRVALKYVLEVLRFGGASAVDSDECDLAPEKIFSLAPELTESNRLSDFLHGGILPSMPKISDGCTSVQRVPSTVPTAAKLVFDALTRSEQPTLWIHEPLLTEVQLTEREIPYVLLGGEIYLVHTNISDENHVASLIRYSLLSWHLLAFVTEGGSAPESVFELFRTSELTLVGAYDGESFVYLEHPRASWGRSPTAELSRPGSLTQEDLERKDGT